MRLAVRVALLSALAGVVMAPVRAGESWYVEFEEGRAAAKAEGKDLLIDLGGSYWCAACKWIKDRVFSKAEFIERAGGALVLVDIDLPVRSPIPADRKRRYEELQERYGKPIRAAGPPCIMPCTGCSSSTCPTLTIGRAAWCSVRVSGSVRRSATGMAAP